LKTKSLVSEKWGKMKLVLALATLAMPASAIAEELPRTAKPSRVPMVCAKSGEQVSGLSKVCYYTCAKSDGAMTVATYEPCPHWTPRWRLNRTAHAGPTGNSRQ
jgi:hypothetical protein